MSRVSGGNPRKGFLRKFSRFLPLVIPVALYFVARAFLWSIPPIWDSRVNFLGLVEATEKPFDLLNYSVAGHISQGFFLLMSIPLHVFGSDWTPFSIWLTLLGLASVYFFYRLAEHYIPTLEPWKASMLTIMFAFHPTLFSNMTQFNFDSGFLCFFLGLWISLAKEKRIQATTFAVLLLFTKETAFLIVPLLWVVLGLTQGGLPFRQWAKRSFWVLGIPYLLLGFFLIYKMGVRNQKALWVLYNDSSPLRTLTDYLFPDAFGMNFFGMTFILNFSWLLILAWGFLVVLVYRSRPLKPDRRCFERLLLALCVLFLGTGLIVQLVRPFSNARYVMVVLPIVILGLFQCLHSLFPSTRSFNSIYFLCATPLFLSNFLTIDPISKSFFGTFPFGRHELLSMTRRTGECCGWGRDQLVYNLEFLHLQNLLKKAARSHAWDNNTVVATHSLADWYFFSNFERNSYSGTLATQDVIIPSHRSVGDLLRNPETARKAFYLSLPNFEHSENLAILSKLYSKQKTNAVEEFGYRLEIVELEY